jgi:hypothetical protein
VGNVIDGIVDVNARVKTEFGEFALRCAHNHTEGEKVSLLLKQSPSPKGSPRGVLREGARGEGANEIKLKVEDVLFKREQFQVKGSGVVIHMNERPEIGQTISVQVEVECLP